MIEEKTIINKFMKKKAVECRLCGQMMFESDLKDMEYVKTKHNSEFFFHTQCFYKEKEGKLHG